MQYRREVDGLRALAVLPVMLFHAGFALFSGGFVGVDVFFVISGYLITGILLEENEVGRFSIASFYERRARRILPALLLVVGICMPLAWLWLLPRDMLGFARSVVAVAMFASNIQFKRESGYFDTDGELKPLLHTWSLGVEEQYYLVFPLFMTLSWQLGKRWMLALLAVAALASLGVSQWWAGRQPGAAYFLLSSRGWELLIGSFVAFFHASARKPQSRYPALLGEAAGIAGLAMLCYAVLAFDRHTSFPGLHALLPTLGTALILLYVTPGTLAGRLLGTKWLVGLGLISYSAYLFHQPLLAFARYTSLLEPAAPLRAALCVSALALAYLSWRIVEAPFRDKARYARREIFRLALAGSVSMLVLGGLGIFFRGFENRGLVAHLPPGYLAQSWIDHGGILGVDGKPCVSENGQMCRVNSAPGHKKTLLVGDSHSADFTAGFRRQARQQGLDAWQMSVGGCAFIPAHFARHQGDCGRARQALEEAVRRMRFDEILIVTNLDDHADQIEEGARAINMASFRALLLSMLDQGAKVTYFTPRPYFNASPTRAAVLRSLDELKVVTGPGRGDVSAVMAPLTSRPGFRVFDQHRVLLDAGCGARECFNGHTKAMLPLYRDAGHLTSLGAALVFDALPPWPESSESR